MARDNPELLTETVKENMGYSITQSPILQSVKSSFGMDTNKGTTLTSEDDTFMQVLTKTHDISDFTKKDAAVNEIVDASRKWLDSIPDEREQDKRIKQMEAQLKEKNKTNPEIKKVVDLLKDSQRDNKLITKIYTSLNPPSMLSSMRSKGGEAKPASIKYQNTHKTLSCTPSNNGTRRKK
jgi:DNA repair ATPase RecN